MSGTLEPRGDHPWARYLEARAAVIVWLASQGNSDKVIAGFLSPDAEQVRAIREYMQREDAS